jgi:hypothetical protein
MKNVAPATEMQITLLSDTKGANIYFQTVDASFADDPSGFGFQLLNGNNVTGSDVTALPIYYYAMDSSTVTMYMAKVTGALPPILVNIFLWADQALASLKLEWSGLTAGAPVKYGWAHNAPVTTINSGTVLTWENK